MVSDWIERVELEDERVKLVPVELAHFEGLLSALNDGKLNQLWFTAVPSPDTLEDYIRLAMTQNTEHTGLAFTIYCKKSGLIIGCTRFCNIDHLNKRLEIGYTWYAKSVQRSGVNTAVKRLLLSHAFVKLTAIAVEFRTHRLNVSSNKAILRLGAKLDGVLRNHKKLADGSLRDTMVYSITNYEWPSVQNHLNYLIEKYPN
jgi:RimJ/RimL family protein N-acetyltransferase